MDYNPDEFPVVVTLRFRSEADKNLFMGGLSDGWGENACSLAWDTTTPVPPESAAPFAFAHAPTFLVTPVREEEEAEEDE